MAIVRICSCEQCKYCLRNHKHAKYQVKKAVRKFRHQTKLLIKAYRFDDLPTKADVGYVS